MLNFPSSPAASCQRELAYVARIQMCTPIMFESMEVQDEYNASHSFAILGVPSVRLQTVSSNLCSAKHSHSAHTNKAIS